MSKYSTENNIVVAVLGRSQFDDFMSVLEQQGWKWRTGLEPTEKCYNKIGDSIDKYIKDGELGIVIIELWAETKRISYCVLSETSYYEEYEEYFDNSYGYVIVPYTLIKGQLEV